MTATTRLVVSVAAVLFAAWSAGCAHVPRQGGFDDVQNMVMERTDQHVVWRQGHPEDRQVDARIEQALQNELNVEQAVSIALLNNRWMQATWEELGITQADVVQAGLLANPTFGLSSRWPSRPTGTGANIELDMVGGFVDMAMVPLRKRLAGQQFEQVKLLVAHAALELAWRVTEAYYTLQSAQQVHAMRMLAFEASDASYELARRMHKAGNINDLQLARQQGLLEQNRVEAGKAGFDVGGAREVLSRLMGLYGPATQYRIEPKLHGLPDTEPAMDQLESLAVERRLDLAAALRQTQTLAEALGVTRDYRYLLLTEIGVGSERDLDGTWVTGPQFALEVPIFDQKQAVIAKAEAQLRQAEHRLWAMAVDVRSEVRVARDRVSAARRLATHYRDVIIPLRERVVQHTTEEHNYMLSGVFEAIAAREDEYEAYQAYTEAVRDYWIARAQLAAAVGGRLPQDPSSAHTPADAPVRTSISPIVKPDVHERNHEHDSH